jgi:hypothetical protein
MEFLIGAALLGGLLVAGILLLAVVVLKTVFWALTLPVRLLFFPFWIARTALRLVGLVILAPILAVGGVLFAGVLIITGLLAVLAPLLPLVVITFFVWLVVRSVSHRAVQVS